MPGQDTDKRVTAQPIPLARLERLRDEIENPSAWVTGPLARAEAAALCGDAIHWRAMYKDGLEARVELAAEVKRLNEMRGDDVESIERLEAERDEARDVADDWRDNSGFDRADHPFAWESKRGAADS